MAAAMALVAVGAFTNLGDICEFHYSLILPAFRQTFTLMPCSLSNLLHSAFIFSAKGPGMGSRIKGAEALTLSSLLCQEYFFASFSSLLSLLLHTLGLWTSLPPGRLEAEEEPVGGGEDQGSRED